VGNNIFRNTLENIYGGLITAPGGGGGMLELYRQGFNQATPTQKRELRDLEKELLDKLRNANSTLFGNQFEKDIVPLFPPEAGDLR
jgi:hypothetical protein